MSDKKIIAVAGATGAQGGGLVRAIQADQSGAFTARAITRNPESEAAQKLKALGAEVVQGDLEDPDSIERAFRGADGAYCVTFYWAHMSPDRELTEARTLANAAQREGVKHVVWSTLEDTRRWVPIESDQMPTIHKRYKVPHFDVKGEADAFFAGLPTTFLLTSFYWDNLIGFGMNPKPDGQGGYTITLPIGEAKMPGIAAEDIGKCAYGVFKQGASTIGKHIGIAGEHVSGAEMAATLSDVLGINVRHHAASPEEFRNYGFPGADDLGNMFQFKRDFETAFRSARSIETSRELNPELLNFRQWVEQHKAEISLT